MSFSQFVITVLPLIWLVVEGSLDMLERPGIRHSHQIFQKILFLKILNEIY